MPRQGDPIHPEVTPWFVFYYISETLQRIDHAYATLRNLDLKLLVDVRALLAWGIVQLLASLEEAVVILREMNPALSNAGDGFASSFEHWRGFRDDAAHVADRLFRLSRGSLHDAVVPNSEWGRAVEVLNYEFKTDSLSTGLHVLHIPTAITMAKKLKKSISDALLRAVIVDKELAWPPLVGPDGRELKKMPPGRVISEVDVAWNDATGVYLTLK